MAHFGHGVGGAAGGAATGAAIGSVIPGIGTAIGAGVGALTGGLFGLFGKKKKKGKPKKVSTLDPAQEKLYGEYQQGLYGQGPFSDLYNYNAEAANENFDKNVSRPAERQFKENIIPGITGQFRGNNLMNSTYAGESLSRAGRDVQEALDAQRSQMHYQGQQDVLNRKQNSIDRILNMQTFAYEKPGAQNPSYIDQVLNSAGPAVGEWFADYLKSKNGASSSTKSSTPATTAQP